MIRRHILTNSSGTLTSRILGFIRDLMMASVLGAGMYSDIFFVAFKFPNLFRRIFGEGAFNQAFLPAFTHARFKGPFANRILEIFLLILLILSLLVTLFSETVTTLIAYGFGPELIAKAAPLVALNFWYLDLIFLVTFLGAMLQYKNCFWPSAYGPAMLNLALIAALGFSIGRSSEETVWYLSVGVLVGGLLQLFLMIQPMKQQGMLRLMVSGWRAKTYKKERAKEESSGFYRQFFPAVIGSSTAQLSAFLDTFLASFLVAGSISYLYYANRIFQLPFAIFALAVSTALFPTISRAIKNQDEERAHRLLRESFWILATLLSVFCVGGIILGNEVIWLLFERGEFVREDTLQSGAVLAMYMVGLLPFGIAKLFSLWLYAHQRQAQAAKISFWALLCNVVFSLLLFGPMGVGGLALASSLGGIVLLVLTLHEFGLNRFWDIIADKKLIGLLLIVIVEAVVLVELQDYVKVLV